MTTKRKFPSMPDYISEALANLLKEATSETIASMIEVKTSVKISAHALTAYARNSGCTAYQRYIDALTEFFTEEPEEEEDTYEDSTNVAEIHRISQSLNIDFELLSEKILGLGLEQFRANLLK